MDSRPASDLFERLFASLPGLYLALAPDLKIEAVTDAYLEATATRRAGIVGRHYFDVFPADPGEIDAWSSGLRASFETVRNDRVVDVIPVEPHHVRVPAEGASAQQVRYWSTVNTPLLDEDGRLLAIVHQVQDVTELVQLTDGGDGPTSAGDPSASVLEVEVGILRRSEQLRIANERLKAAVGDAQHARRFLESVVENIPSAVYVKDTEHRFVQVNRAYEELTGWSRSDVVGKHPYEVYAREVADAFIKVDLEMFEHPAVVEMPVHLVETRTLGPRLTTGRKIPIVGADGAVQFILGISEDVTDSHQAAERLREANDKMSASLSALERRNEEMRRLNDLGDLLQACIDGPEACRVVAHSMPGMFPGSSGAVSVVKPSRNLLETAASWGDWWSSGSTFAPDDCWSLRRGKLHESGVSGPPCRHFGPENLGLRALCVPMIAQGETIGVFHLLRGPLVAEPPETDDGAVQLASMVSDHIGMAIANLDLREKLRHLSIRDPLTNLFNRRYMEETFAREIERAARDGDTIGVGQLDIDHYKVFNDTHGHEAGDVVLKAIADLLMSRFRGGDVACRYGGEELTLILPRCSLDSTCERLEELRGRFRELVIPYRGSVLTTPTLSMGVAAYPEHGATSGELLRAADQALYQAKENGRDRIVRAARR